MEADLDVSLAAFLGEPRALVLGGGRTHPFEQGCDELAAIVAGTGVEVEVIDDPGELGRLDHELLVVDAMWWSMVDRPDDPHCGEWARRIDDLARRAIEDHVRLGRGILAVHTAVVCFDDWPVWGELLGGTWSWGRSWHPPFAGVPVHVSVATDRHEIVRGLGDFDIVDEVYCDLGFVVDVEPLAWAAVDGVEHPLVWARELDSGSRVVVDLLGHDHRSMTHLAHHELLRRSVAWLLDRDIVQDGEAAA